MQEEQCYNKGMKIALLGYGKEGQAAAAYFKAKGAEIKIFDHFTPEEIAKENFSGYDLVLRSPSVRPMKGVSSMTRYFFDKCPCKIIGVTGTKGKGTTCSLIKSVLEAMGKKVFLVGNIGMPAIEVLDELKKDDVVVYELSSFQLWDLKRSPEIAVVLPIEPDHLNVHKNMAEYVAAKANIAKWQSKHDICIYNTENDYAVAIADQSSGETIPYPVREFSRLVRIAEPDQSGKRKLLQVTKTKQKLHEALDFLAIVGHHNRENGEAALLAVASFLKMDLSELLAEHFPEICNGLGAFHGLPHRLEFVRELNQVKYYDDNFATGVASMEVALKSFAEPTVLILGGRDKMENQDLPKIHKILEEHENLTQVILIGESGHEIYRRWPEKKFVVAESLEKAVELAQSAAEKVGTPAVVVMSPAAASFDMFENAYDRGDQFQKLVKELL